MSLHKNSTFVDQPKRLWQFLTRMANRQSCDPSVTLLFKLVLRVVVNLASCSGGKDYAGGEH